MSLHQSVEQLRHLGPFEIHESIGSGGMGTIYRAHRLGPGGFRKEVALKVVQAEDHQQYQQWRRFLFNEGCLGARIRHRNIVEIFEVGEVDDKVYLSMQYIDGPNLSTILKRGGALPLEAVVDLGIQLCDGLEYAHALRLGDAPAPVIHCDLKPTNIVVDLEGRVYIIDLGIAVPQGVIAGGDGGLCGTFAYMSPQVLSGEPVGPGVDLFGVGVVLYEAATGKRLLNGSGPSQLIPQIVSLARALEGPEILAPVNAVSGALAELIADLLVAERGGQTSSASETRERLETISSRAENTAALAECAREHADRSGSRNSRDVLPTIETSLIVAPTWFSPNTASDTRSFNSVKREPRRIELEIGSVDLESGRISRLGDRGSGAVLSPTEAKLLTCLLKNPAKIMAPEHLVEEIWEERPGSSSRTLTATIESLRSKIERDPQIPRHLVTAPRQGFSFHPLQLDAGAWPGEAWPPSETNLVPQNDAFIGRKEELQRSRDALGPGRVVTLKGTGGIGKTRLAQELGLQVQTIWPGGTWFCGLAGARTTDQALQLIATTLGIVSRGEGGGELPDSMGRAIASRSRVLIILDNAEQIIEELSRLVSRWRRQAPMACFLVTSREALRIEGEEVIELAPLSPKDAVELLIHRAAAASPPRTLTHSPLLEQIVERVDRLPLAIELVAGRLGLLNPMAILDNLKHRFSLLRSRRRDRPPRHAALNATIDWSWQLLKPWEQAVLAQLSIFEEGFDFAAAAAVVDLTPWEDEVHLFDVVADLLDKSLLHSQNLEGRPRLFLYQSLREFAAIYRVALEEDGPVWGVHRVAFRFARFQARRGDPDAILALNLHQGGQLRKALAIELPNLQEAHRLALAAQDHETAARCAIAAIEVLLLRGPFDQARQLADQALSSSRLLTTTRLRLRYLRAELSRLTGKLAEAEESFISVREQAAAQKMRVLAAKASAQLSSIRISTGREDTAIDLLVDAIRTAEACGDCRHIGFFRCRLGTLWANTGDIGQARENLDIALTASRDAGDLWTEGVALHVLASCDSLQGDLESAEQRCQEAIHAYRAVGCVRDESVVLGMLGQLAHRAGELERARQRFSEAIQLSGRIGHQVAQGVLLGMLGEIEGQTGHPEEARNHLEQGEALLWGTDEIRELVQLLCRRAIVELRGGRPVAAGEALARADLIIEFTPVSAGLARKLAGLRTGMAAQTRLL